MRTFTLALTVWWVLAPLATLRGIGFTQFFGAGVAAGGPSYVEKESQTGAAGGSYPVGSSAVTRWRGTKFTAASSYNLNRVDVYVSRNGSSAINYTVEIWSHDSMSNLPNAMIGTASSSISNTTFPDSEDVRTFYPTATIVSGTVYYIVMKSDAANATCGLWHWASLTGGQVVTYSTGDSTWSSTSTTRTLKYILYGDS
jgi:hypothetical protein